MIEQLPWDRTIIDEIPWGPLTVVVLAVEVVLASLAFAYTRRLSRLGALPLGDVMNGYQQACRKLRGDEPVTRDEWDLAARIIDVRRHPLAYAVPAAFMTTGIFYIVGSMAYLHGAHPSERTFLGVIPMLTSTSIMIRMRNTARLRRKLPSATIVEEGPALLGDGRGDPVQAPPPSGTPR